MNPLRFRASGMTRHLIGVAIEAHEDKETNKFGLHIDRFLFDRSHSNETVYSIHKSQLLSYLIPLDVPAGWIIDFCVHSLNNGISGLVLPGVNLE